MDDKQKVGDQNINTPLASSTTQGQTQSPVQTVGASDQAVQGSEQVVQIQPQVQSVGSVHKEQGPVRAVVEKSDVELKIDKELEDIGVEAKTDNINLTSEHTQAGLQHSGSSVPVTTLPSNNVGLPQTPIQIKADIKKTKPTDSLRGLLLEILKNIQRIGLKEQKV